MKKQLTVQFNDLDDYEKVYTTFDHLIDAILTYYAKTNPKEYLIFSVAVFQSFYSLLLAMEKELGDIDNYENFS